MRVRWVLVVLLLCGCSTAVQQLVLDPADGSVLSGAEARRTLDQCSHYGPVEATSTWAPSGEQIAELEMRLAGFLRRQDFRPPGDPRAYYRQYVGVVLGGREFIYVNGFPKDSVSDNVASLQQFMNEHPEVKFTDQEIPQSMRTLDGWRSHAVVVCDGGSYYWGALYDVKKKRFRSYSANGFA
jgi:hypothetical protein